MITASPAFETVFCDSPLGCLAIVTEGDALRAIRVLDRAPSAPAALSTVFPDGKALSEIRMTESAPSGLAAALSAVFPESRITENASSASSCSPPAAKTLVWLRSYFSGGAPDPSVLPLAPVGTPFCHTVWKLLLQIPYGQTVTYGALAEQTARMMGRLRMSARAIGQAVSKNPIPIIIPCHRVVAAHGAIGGYALGTGRKILLLHLEGSLAIHQF